MDLAGKMVAYLCPGCGTQGTQLVAVSGGDKPPVVCPACGSRVMSRELASSREERSSVEV
ncbi:MAG: hypothetical protein ACM3X4_08000 [Ignavibacteriales bacterium]